MDHVLPDFSALRRPSSHIRRTLRSVTLGTSATSVTDIVRLPSASTASVSSVVALSTGDSHSTQPPARTEERVRRRPSWAGPRQFHHRLGPLVSLTGASVASVIESLLDIAWALFLGGRSSHDASLPVAIEARPQHSKRRPGPFELGR